MHLGFEMTRDKSNNDHVSPLFISSIAEDRRMKLLLAAGVRSSMQIAGMPKSAFLEKWMALFPGEEVLGETVYRHAVARRAYVLLHRIRKVQDNEPHYRAARF